MRQTSVVYWKLLIYIWNSKKFWRKKQQQNQQPTPQSFPPWSQIYGAFPKDILINRSMLSYRGFSTVKVKKQVLKFKTKQATHTEHLLPQETSLNFKERSSFIHLWLPRKVNKNDSIQSLPATTQVWNHSCFHGAFPCLAKTQLH